MKMPFYGQGWFHVTTYHLAQTRPVYLSLSVSVTSANIPKYIRMAPTITITILVLDQIACPSFCLKLCSCNTLPRVKIPSSTLSFCCSAPGRDWTNATLIRRYTVVLGDTGWLLYNFWSTQPSPKLRCDTDWMSLWPGVFCGCTY